MILDHKGNPLVGRCRDQTRNSLVNANPCDWPIRLNRGVGRDQSIEAHTKEVLMGVCVGSGAIGTNTDNKKLKAEYHIFLKVAVESVSELWQAAALSCVRNNDLTDADIADTIGPCEDPSIEDCLAMLALPDSIAGCRMIDFGLHPGGEAGDALARPLQIGANGIAEAVPRLRLDTARTCGQLLPVSDIVAAPLCLSS